MFKPAAPTAFSAGPPSHMAGACRRWPWLHHQAIFSRFRIGTRLAAMMVLAGLVAAAALSGDWGALGRAIAAGAALLAFYLVLALINPSGLGLGDVKLSGVLGMFLGWLGWPAVLAGTLAAFALNAAVALALLAARRVGAKSGIAFGPAMVLGAAAGAAYWAWHTAGLA